MGNGGCNYPYGLNPPCAPSTPYPQVNNPTSGQPEVYLGARSKHSGGVNAAMCDGSVRFFKNTVNINTWQAVSTSQGNEVVSSDSF